MNGITIEGLYKEIYGQYEGRFREDGQQIYLTTDRYFEKFVLNTDDGVYEIWAGGYRKKEDTVLTDFEQERRFEVMRGERITSVKTEPDKSLMLTFQSGSSFEIGLCPEYNQYNHPERYMTFTKTKP